MLPVYELIGSLPNLPAGYAKRNDSTPLEQTFGLSQRPRLQDASDDLYRQALERLMRPRLILSLEQQIQKNIDDPSLRLRGAQGLSDARRQGAAGRQ